MRKQLCSFSQYFLVFVLEQLTEPEAEFSAPSRELMEKFNRILSSPVDAPSESLTIKNRKQDFKVQQKHSQIYFGRWAVGYFQG